MHLAFLHGFQGLNLSSWSGLFHNCFYWLSHLAKPHHDFRVKPTSYLYNFATLRMVYSCAWWCTSLIPAYKSQADFRKSQAILIY